MAVGTSNVQIEEALRGVHTALPFIGAFPSDRLPVRAHRPFSLIANYGKAGTPGSHWIAMAFPAIGPAYYFDSYGLQPDQADGVLKTNTSFARFMRANSATGTYNYNQADFQCLETGVCGEYATFFIKHGAPEDNPAAWHPIIQWARCKQRDETVRRLAAVLPKSERQLAPESKFRTL